MFICQREINDAICPLITLNPITGTYLADRQIILRKMGRELSFSNLSWQKRFNKKPTFGKHYAYFLHIHLMEHALQQGW